MSVTEPRTPEQITRDTAESLRMVLAAVESGDWIVYRSHLEREFARPNIELPPGRVLEGMPLDA